MNILVELRNNGKQRSFCSLLYFLRKKKNFLEKESRIRKLYTFMAAGKDIYIWNKLHRIAIITTRVQDLLTLLPRL